MFAAPSLTATTVAVLAASTAAQGFGAAASTQRVPPQLEYSQNPTVEAFAPFQTAIGDPRPVVTTAAGCADFDADQHLDAWFLAPATNGGQELSVQMARASSLGRFRGWHTFAARPADDAATFRSTAYSLGDRVLLVDRQSTTLLAAHYTYAFATNPQGGGFALNSSWPVVPGCYEIDTRDADGDGHDDIGVLAELPGGQTLLLKLCMDTSMGFLAPARQVRATLPAVARALRLLDVDGDGRADAVVHFDGGGIGVLRDDGSAFRWWLYLPYPWPIEDVFAGDTDRDGRDEVGIVLTNGVVLLRATPSGWDAVGLAHPGGALAPFHAATAFGERLGKSATVLAYTADGGGVALFPALGAGSFGRPQVYRAPPDTAYAGIGPARGGAVSLLRGDADGDGDEDVFVQLADRAHWLRLLNREIDRRPVGVQLVDRGKVGETGLHQWEIELTMPFARSPTGATEVELAVFQEDVTLPSPEFVYWGRDVRPIDPSTAMVRFTTFVQTVATKLPQLIARGPHWMPGGLTFGGEVMLSAHYKDPANALNGGARRDASAILYWSGGGLIKSAIGARWSVHTTPPAPAIDDDVLPWN